MWYSEDGNKWGMHPDILYAHACTQAQAGHYLEKFRAVGVPIEEAICIPCDNTALTDEQRKLLNIA